MFRWIEVGKGPRSDVAFCRTQVGSYRSFSLWWSTASLHLAVPGASQLSLGNRYRYRVWFFGGSSKPKNGPRNIQRVERDEPSGKIMAHLPFNSRGINSRIGNHLLHTPPRKKRFSVMTLHCRDSHIAKFRNSGHIQKPCLPIGVISGYIKLYPHIWSDLHMTCNNMITMIKWLSYKYAMLVM